MLKALYIPREMILFLCSIIALFCIVFAYKNINDIRGAVFIPSNAYRTTGGEIRTSKISCRGGKTASCSYIISYKYTVAGNDYTSRQIDFRVKRGDSDVAFAEGYVNKYPAGRKVTVHYKADEPSFAVLEPHNKRGGLLASIGIPIVFSLCLLGILYAKGAAKRLKKAS
jgi:hypothetical protein